MKPTVKVWPKLQLTAKLPLSNKSGKRGWKGLIKISPGGVQLELPKKRQKLNC